MPIKYTVLICTLNRYDELMSCIQSINNQNGNHKYEIIIVDQSDSSYIKKFKDDDQIKYYHISERGLSHARNIGLKYASGDIICLMDDDAQVSDNYFNDINTIFNDYRNLSIGCGVIKNFEDGKYFSRYMTDREKIINYNNYDRCMSSAIFFKRDILKKLNYFDEMFGIGTYYGGSEETDFIINALSLNYEVRAFCVPEVYHPKFNINKEKFVILKGKGFSYGLGRGALYKKYLLIKPLWSILHFIRSLSLSTIGILYNLLSFNYKRVVWHAYSLIGRLLGFYSYSVNK